MFCLSPTTLRVCDGWRISDIIPGMGQVMVFCALHPWYGICDAWCCYVHCVHYVLVEDNITQSMYVKQLNMCWQTEPHGCESHLNHEGMNEDPYSLNLTRR